MQLSISTGEIQAGLGGPVKKEFNIKRKIKVRQMVLGGWASVV